MELGIGFSKMVSGVPVSKARTLGWTVVDMGSLASQIVPIKS